MVEGAPAVAATIHSFRDRSAKVAEWLAVAVAVSLPWSTSATSILVPILLLALLPTLDAGSIRRVLKTPAGALPVALWGLGIIGMMWSDASWADKVEALRGFHRLLVIPILLIQFGRSDKGMFVLGAFAVSCTALLWVSWLFWFWPLVSRPGVPAFIPVKDYGTQSGEFLLCAYALAHLALNAWHDHRRVLALALTTLMFAFLANITFVVTSRSTLVACVALVIFVGFQRFGWKGMIIVVVAAGIFAAISWAYSPYLRARVFNVFDEISLYQPGKIDTSTGFRLEFSKKSIEIIAAAPLIGHGTGSIGPLYRGAAEAGAGTPVVRNPHNVTLEVAIQFGFLGVVMLYAMWAAHLLLFSGRGTAAWIGTGLVVWDVVGSLFLSHLFDFSTGWIYVLGVGVIGGMVLRGRPEVPRVS